MTKSLGLICQGRCTWQESDTLWDLGRSPQLPGLLLRMGRPVRGLGKETGLWERQASAVSSMFETSEEGWWLEH